MEQMHFVQEYSPLWLGNLSFLYVVLPFFLLAFYAAPVGRRGGVLLGLSLVYYGLAEPMGLPLLLACVGADYLAVRLMALWDEAPARRRACLLGAIVKNVAVAGTASVLVQVRETPMWLGVILYTVSGMTAVLAMYRREAPYETSIVRFGLYCCFFPRLYAGPLVGYKEFAGELEGLAPTPGQMLEGAGLFLNGVLKSLVLGRTLAGMYRSLADIAPGNITTLSAWSMVIIFAFALYFILSGYCDMARGLGMLFGIGLPRNFYYPYQSRSISDFCQRFNSTVMWAIYRGGQRHFDQEKADIPHRCLNLLVMGMFAGVWFGLRINYMVWGMYLACCIVLEQFVYPRLLEKIPVLLQRVYALALVLVGFTILSGRNMLHTVEVIKAMFGFFSADIPLHGNRELYIISSNWLLLLLSVLFVTNGASLLRGRLRCRAPRLSAVSECAIGAVLLAFITVMSLG